MLGITIPTTPGPLLHHYIILTKTPTARKCTKTTRYTSSLVPLLLIAALFFETLALAPELDTACASVVVTTVVTPLTVLAANVVPGTTDGDPVTLDTLVTVDPPTWFTTVVEATLPVTVLAGTVFAGTVLGEMVVVYVKVTGLPRLLIGIAEPTPLAVY